MSVQLNFSTTTEYELIEYPGMVKNIDNMISTLGGINKISRALGGDTKRLELRYHPDNPFNKPLCGESSKRAGLLLSVKVRKSKRDPNKPPQYTIKIMGYINKSFTFESLCDFQYLPLASEAKSPNGELKNVLDTIVPKSVIDFDYFKRQDVQLMSLPTMFARSDVVHTTIFRGDFSKEDGQNETLGVLSKSSYESRDIVTFSMIDAFPTRPDSQILKKMKVKYVSDEQLQKVKKLFEECPIWTRIALLYESGVSHDKLKCITPSLAYYFTTGPWRTMYVRYGYDPRKDFNSRYYQTFDFRLRFRSGVSEFVSDRKTTIKKLQENPYEINALVQDINYPYFDEHKLPRSRQCMMRYCDIRINKIQEMLEKIPSPMAGAICNERTGWLPQGFDGQVRQIVSNSIKDLLKNYYRKEQIHAEVDSYENEEHEDAEEEEEEDEEMDDSMMNDEQLVEILDEMQLEGEGNT
ncbi:general transcription factor 3C polypeptide 5 [Lucilia sericata]|uniref:general transcription factor 3C polypeptide 5 n=1 Tax=Lucilia sericata TaxID=13632 RepID=UPI0018A864C8|nr:general transcription factor 3C polypeptide 5 [Lucilia sericata]